MYNFLYPKTLLVKECLSIVFFNLLFCGFAFGTSSLTAISDYNNSRDGVSLHWERAFFRGPDINGSGNFDIPFGVLTPYGYSTGGGTQYPLVVYLHGAGARSNWDSSRNDSEIDQVMNRDTAQDFGKASADHSGNPDYRAIVLAPQVAIGNKRWAETNWNAGPYNQTDTAGNTYGEYMHSLELLLDYILDSGNDTELNNVLGIQAGDIDLKRIYVVGDSMGAYGTWDLLARQPELFAAGITSAGSGPKNKLSELQQSAIWAIHGDQDTTVPNDLPDGSDPDGDGSLGMLGMIDPTFDGVNSTAMIYVDDPDSTSDDPTASQKLIYSEFVGMGHNPPAASWTEIMDSDFFSWLFAQSNNNPDPPDGSDIIFDSVSSYSQSTEGSTISWSHTIGAGTNRLLIVGLAAEDTGTDDISVDSVYYNGVRMTEVPGSLSLYASGYSQQTVLYYLPEVDLPAVAGSYTVEAFFAGPVNNRSVGAISLFNVNQNDPFDGVSTSTSSSSPIETSTATTLDGCWLIDIIGCGNTGAFTADASGMSERFEVSTSSSSAAGGTRFIEEDGAAKMRWIHPAANKVAHSVAAIAPFEDIPGDIDGDGGVDETDLSFLCEQWLQTPGEPSADILPTEGDGEVNLLDLASMANDWSK